MPPKPKFTKEEIVRASYELMKARGMDAVVAREVGKQLGTTTGPVFTYFDTMDELKTEVLELARKECLDYLKGSLDYSPAFKEFGLRWIKFAQSNPHAFVLLFMKKSEKPMLYGFMDEKMTEVFDPLTVEVQNTFRLSEEEAKLLIKEMVIFAQGVASMLINGIGDFSEEEICNMISRMCVSRVAGCHIMDDNLNTDMIKAMLSRTGQAPVRKEK